MDEKNFLRQPAKKISINKMLEFDFIEDKKKNLNYLSNLRKKIFRITVYAAVVYKEEAGSITNILLDDGTGKIILRSFEENKNIKELNVGDVLLVIGKIRMFNKERYISYEIVKKINPLWLKVRYLELVLEANSNCDINERETKEEKISFPEQENKKKIKCSSYDQEQLSEIDISDEKIEIENQEDELLPIEKTTKLIKELDQGNGVLIEEIIEKSPLEDVQEIIDKMLENGDIFQNQPGRIKVL